MDAIAISSYLVSCSIWLFYRPISHSHSFSLHTIRNLAHLNPSAVTFNYVIIRHTHTKMHFKSIDVLCNDVHSIGIGSDLPNAATTIFTHSTVNFSMHSLWRIIRWFRQFRRFPLIAYTQRVYSIASVPVCAARTVTERSNWITWGCAHAFLWPERTHQWESVEDRWIREDLWVACQCFT